MVGMSKPKEMIPVANLVLLVDALQAYTETLRKVVDECYDADLPGVSMDGWPTTAAAVLAIRQGIHRHSSVFEFGN